MNLDSCVQRIACRLAFIAGTCLGFVASIQAQPCRTVEEGSVSADPNTLFGDSFSVANDLLVVGARHDGDRGLQAGSASVYRRVAGTWVLEQELYASDAAADHEFGSSVSTDGQKIAVSAPLNPLGGAVFVGVVYVFAHDGVRWIEEQMLPNPSGPPYGAYGYWTESLALEGDWIAVGASRENPGGVYVFHHDGVAWSLDQRLTGSTISSTEDFGWAVDIDDGRIAVGALSGQAPIGLKGAGCVFLFTRDMTSWTEQFIVGASDASIGDHFSSSLALDGAVLLVGAEYDGPPLFTGSAYVFRWNGSLWVEEQNLVAASRAQFDEFGHGVALEGDLALVGANNRNAADLFQFTGSSWVRLETLGGSVGTPPGLGSTVGLDASTAFASTPFSQGVVHHYPLRNLFLDAPGQVNVGDPVALPTCGGRPGAGAMLAVVAVNGAPLFLPVLVRSFNSEGVFGLSGTVPPGLSGNSLTFQSFGFFQAGRIASSAPAAIAFL